MQVTKYFNFGNIEIKIDADYCNEELEIVSVTPIIDKGEDHKEFYENIGDAMMEEIPGFVKLLQKLDWSVEIDEAERERNGKLHSRLFSSWKPVQVELHQPAKVELMFDQQNISRTHNAIYGK